MKNPQSLIEKNLSAEQRTILDDMLFEKNFSYHYVAKMSLASFGLKICPQSVHKYYIKRAQKITLDRIINGTKSANAVVKAFTDNPADTYQAILKVVGQIAFDKALVSPEQLDVRTIKELTMLLISARREDIQAKRLSLSREKWEFDVVRACQEHHAELQAISADKSLDEDARLLAIQRRLFGTRLPE